MEQSLKQVNLSRTLSMESNSFRPPQPGTYQQYVTSSKLYTIRIPDGVSDTDAGPIVRGGATVWKSIKFFIILFQSATMASRM